MSTDTELYTKDQVIKLIEDEPEFPGEPEKELVETLSEIVHVCHETNSIDAMLHAMRLVVKETKKCMLERLEEIK